ncbi:MAG: hypothetical protein HFE04_01090 [Bacilli bacterium]|nr:hypothetical protein [Bacilli bacterium]
MKYDEIEESIQVIANYTLENYTFYNIACETGKKYENTNSPISLFSFILQRLSINEYGKCCNNYMASIDFYSCLLKLREEKLWYGLNISRFRLTLIEMYNLLELENIKEEDPKKTLKL